MTGPQNKLVKNRILGSSIFYATVSVLCLNPYITNTMSSPPPPTHIHTQSAEMLDAIQVRHVSIPSISSHTAVHTDLLPYSALVKWLRDSEPLRFSDVMEVQA